MKRNAIVFFTCLALAACGIKPGAVDPPEGQGSSGFPHAYPNTSTDPKPLMEDK